MEKPKPILFESMTRFTELPGLTVRCWREENDYNSDIETATYEEIRVEIDKLNENPHLLSRVGIATTLLNIDRMNAVEVLDINGDGCVVYKDWP